MVKSSAELLTEAVCIQVEAIPPNPGGLCMCGCGRRTNIAKNTVPQYRHIKGHPMRYVSGHGSRLVNPFTVMPNGCWIWKGKPNASGYGMTGIGPSRARQAHIVYYERAYGKTPPGKQLDHTCKNKMCVNPKHLEPVTQAENVRRSAPKMTHATAAEAKRLVSLGVGCKELMARFGISKSHAFRFYQGRTWR